MIGNDIVDLALARKESNWKRAGFLEKIFTNVEQQLISNAENPEIMVWNLWSRKEAAYKIYNRQTGIRAYIPIQLECEYENAVSGSVSCNGKIYYTNTKISNDEIHTVAVTKIVHLNLVSMVKPTENIKKINGVPWLNNTNKGITPISLSHHGRFTACVKLD